MPHLEIDKKKYVLISKKYYIKLQIKAALKTAPDKLLTIDKARSTAKKIIRKWAFEKLQ